MKSEGWIKLHRCILDKPIWKASTPEQKTILIAIVLMADHQPNEWEWKGKPYKTKPGEMVTSHNSIAKNSGKGISKQNVRTALKRFEKYEFLTYQSTHLGLLVTVINWASYQSLENTPNTPTKHTANTPLTPNKNVKKERKKKNIPDSDESGDFYLTKKKRKLEKKRLETFNIFWEKFDHKYGKADAADSWLDIPVLTDALVNQIYLAAENESKLRQDKIDKGQTPKWAQGWITSRRWEDDINQNAKPHVIHQKSVAELLK